MARNSTNIRTMNRDGQRQVRPGSLWQEFWRVLLQPVAFFQNLPFIRDTRQWLAIGLLIIGVTSFSAVRYEKLLAGEGTEETAGTTDDPTGEFPIEAPPSDPFAQPGGFPVEQPVETDGEAAEADAAANQSWTTAIVSAGSLILWWIVLAVLLCEVTLLNGALPDLGLNFQIAIWSSVPLGIMAGLQLAYYYSTDGQVGKPGISGFLAEWPAFADQSELVQKLLFSLAQRFTIFWVWSLFLVYFGARYALRGRLLAALIVVMIWFIVVVGAPVLLGTIELPPELEPISEEQLPVDSTFEEMPFEEFPSDPTDVPPEGEQFPPDEVFPEVTPEPGVRPR